MKQDRYLDELLLLALREIFPDHTVPDEENIRPDGSKYPAPDHFLKESNLFIERKSLNPEPKSVLAKVNSIRQQAGLSSVRFYGRLSSRQLFQNAPEQSALIKKLNDYQTNQLRKVFRSVEKKYSSFMLETGMRGVPILLLSDSTLESKDSGLFEYTIGSLMQKQSVDWSAGHVAATLFIALPEAIHNTLNGHWVKLLIRGDINASDRQNIEIAIYRILDFVQERLSHDGKLVNKPLWNFRSLVV